MLLIVLSAVSHIYLFLDLFIYLDIDAIYTHIYINMSIYIHKYIYTNIYIHKYTQIQVGAYIRLIFYIVPYFLNLILECLCIWLM